MRPTRHHGYGGGESPCCNVYKHSPITNVLILLPEDGDVRSCMHGVFYCNIHHDSYNYALPTSSQSRLYWTNGSTANCSHALLTYLTPCHVRRWLNGYPYIIAQIRLPPTMPAFPLVREQGETVATPGREAVGKSHCRNMKPYD